MDPPVADTRRIDGGDVLGHLGGLLLDVAECVGLREPWSGEHDCVDLHPRQHGREFAEQLRPWACVLALSAGATDRGPLLGAVLCDRVDVGLPLLDGGDGDIGVVGGLDRRRQSVALVGLEAFLDLEFGVLFDVDGVVLAELVLAGALLDAAADAQTVGETGELDGVDVETDPDVLALAAGVPELVVVALDAPGRVARHPVARLHDMREMPQVVETLRNHRQTLPVSLCLHPVGDAHTSVSTVAGKWVLVAGGETRHRSQVRGQSQQFTTDAL